MIDSNRRRLSGFAVAAALCPTLAGAQTVARSFDELKRDLKPAQTVVVTDGTGAKTQGRVAEVSESSLLLRTKEKHRDSSGHEFESWTGQRTFAQTDVTEIIRKDSLRDGTLLGLGIGFAAFVLALKTDSCAPFPYDLCYHSHGVFPLLVYPTVGAVAGALIDRATGNARVYLARSRSSATSVIVSPLLRPGGGGVAFLMKL